MHRNKSVDTHRFAMVEAPQIPRSAFRIQKTLKTTMNGGWLTPIYVDEVLPGDSFNLKATVFARMSTPLFPIMDNLHFDTFFFYVPNRLVWTNWVRMMGEQDNPGDSTDFLVPQVVSPAGGYAPGSMADYMGLPLMGQVAVGNTYSHSALWFRAYNLIYNEWFRDENLQTRRPINKGDGPDNFNDYQLMRRGKRHDYFTSALPWPQKGNSVGVPILSNTAPVISNGQNVLLRSPGTTTDNAWVSANVGAPTAGFGFQSVPGNAGNIVFGSQSGLYTDLSATTSITINQLRQSFQVQRLLERDARGGTRYTELLRSHFGVQSPDARLQRPEYLGGGSTPVGISPVAQTSAAPGAGGTTPLGTIGAMGTILAHGHGFRQSFTEHGMIIGLACIRADLTYQQGMRRMWSRKTRYDYYFPAFAHLGEQTILNKEIYLDGSAADDAVFGYQERWSEYRYNPSQITGLFRSTTANTLDAWHLSQKFTARPTLATTFIEETPPIDRVLAVPAGPGNMHFIVDIFYNTVAVRPLPMWSTPGLIDHL